MFHFGFRSPPSAGSESAGWWEKLAVLSSACFVSYNFASLSLCSSPKPLSASSIAGILPKEILSTGERQVFFPLFIPSPSFRAGLAVWVQAGAWAGNAAWGWPCPVRAVQCTAGLLRSCPEPPCRVCKPEPLTAAEGCSICSAQKFSKRLVPIARSQVSELKWRPGNPQVAAASRCFSM